MFTEQGASALHMTAGNVLDTISPLPGCSGQVSDAAGGGERHTQIALSVRNGLPIDLDTMAESKTSKE